MRNSSSLFLSTPIYLKMTSFPTFKLAAIWLVLAVVQAQNGDGK